MKYCICKRLCMCVRARMHTRFYIKCHTFFKTFLAIIYMIVFTIVIIKINITLKKNTYKQNETKRNKNLIRKKEIRKFKTEKKKKKKIYLAKLKPNGAKNLEHRHTHCARQIHVRSASFQLKRPQNPRGRTDRPVLPDFEYLA